MVDLIKYDSMWAHTLPYSRVTNLSPENKRILIGDDPNLQRLLRGRQI